MRSYFAGNRDGYQPIGITNQSINEYYINKYLLYGNSIINNIHVFFVKSIITGGIFGIRHLQCFLLFCCLTVAYALRVNLSVAIVAMTEKNSTTGDKVHIHSICLN